jgi:cation transport regulator ChaB
VTVRFFAVRGYAETTIDAYAEEDWRDDESPEIYAVCSAWQRDRRRLAVTPDTAHKIAWGLIEMANTEDCAAEINKKKAPECAAMSRAARDGLSTAARRIWTAYAK